MSRAAQLNCQHGRSCALVLTLFLFQKGQGFFPPLPIAALLPRSWRWAYLSRAGWEVSMWLGHFAARINGLIFFFPRCRESYAALAGWDASMLLKNATQKASVSLNSRWPLLRAMRPVAEWRSMLSKRQGAAPDRRAARPVAERR